MPVTEAQLKAGANKQLEVYASNDPIDQFTTARPFSKWLIANKEDTLGGNEYFNEKVRISNDSNYQNYKGDDQVTYNRRDVVRLAKFPWANFHDGFGINEDELARNGINIAESGTTTVVSGAEKIQIYNLIKENYAALKDSAQEGFDLEAHRDGSQDPKAVQGLDFLVSTTPAVGTVGGIDSSTALYWRNNTNLGLTVPTDLATALTFLEKMEDSWRACTRFGGEAPNKIFVGEAFYNAFKKAVNLVNGRQVNIVNGSGAPGAPAIDGATGNLYFNSVLVEWDPVFERLDQIEGVLTHPWTKRCYFLNSKYIKLRPLKGHWMVNRKPPRMYDRYVYYWAITSKYRITIGKRNVHAVLSNA